MRKLMCLAIVGFVAILIRLQVTAPRREFAIKAASDPQRGLGEVQTGASFDSGKHGLYDPQPNHIWNRLYRAFCVRAAWDGREYGYDALDPLLWYETKYLLSGPSHQQAINGLDEFLSTKAERFIVDPLHRAMLQRDLWAVFDWSTERSYDPSAYKLAPARRNLQIKLAQVIRRLALSEEQIQALPNTYADAIAAKAFAPQYDSNRPETPFLPPDLFQPDGPWVALSAHGGGPVAIGHVVGFSGRSAFLVFMRLPGGREATLGYLKKLSDFPQPWIPNPRHPTGVLPNPELPQFPVGTQLALVRQIILIDHQGHLTPTRLTESVQIRVHRTIPTAIPEALNLDSNEARTSLDVFEFKLSRARLFAGIAGGLGPVAQDEKEFPLFRSHGYDPFELAPEHGPIERHLGSVLMSCAHCHFRPGIHSVLSRERHALIVSWDPKYEADGAIGWKHGQYNWGLLEGLWELPPTAPRR
jgi:hypothetical protein